MALTTQVDSVNLAIAMDLSSLAASSTWTAGVNSTEIQNAAAGYLDALVTVLPITATASAVGQYIGVWLAAQNVSFATNPITAAGMIDGVAGACNLVNPSTVASLILVGSATATGTSATPYVIEPFSIAQQFGGIMPKFWSLFVAHNLGTALPAALNNLFSYNGITYATN